MQIRNDFVHLPSGRSLGEAKVGHFEIGPLHNFLAKKFVVQIGYGRRLSNTLPSHPASDKGALLYSLLNKTD